MTALVAQFALKVAVAFFGVHSEVLSQIGLLRETLRTTRLGAHERPLAGVHSQMVEKVMPFAEEHAALFVVAL